MAPVTHPAIQTVKILKICEIWVGGSMQTVKLEERRNIIERTSEWRRICELGPTSSHKQMRIRGYSMQ